MDTSASIIMGLALHAAWALVVLIRKNEEQITRFHRFSIAVWIVWLIPYLSPMVFNIAL